MNDLATILAPGNRPGKSKTAHPFSALPHALRKDPRLKRNHLAIVLAAALLEYARDRPSCYPTNATLAEDLDCAQSTVRAAMAALKVTGWVRTVVGPRQPNGRRIFLTWREGVPAPSTVPQVSDTRHNPGTHRRPASTPRRPAGTKEEIVVVEGIEVQSEPERPERSRPEPIFSAAPLPPAAPEPCPSTGQPPASPPTPEPGPPARPAPQTPTATLQAPAPGHHLLTPEEKSRLDAMDPGVRDQILTWLMLGDPILMREARAKLRPTSPRPAAPRTLRDLLTNICVDPSYPAKAADWLCTAFNDRKSYNGYLRRCEEAWRGSLSVDRLVAAYDQASGGKAKVPGAVFMTVVQLGC